MKKIMHSRMLNASLLGLAVVLLMTIAFSEQTEARDYSQITKDMFKAEDADQFNKGLAIGAQLPNVKALFQGRVITDLKQFSGKRGLVIIASRSLDWCPFCMHQAAKLGQISEQFEQAGLGIVMVTYDTPDIQQAFANNQNLSYPIISDIKAQTMMALNVLHAGYPRGHQHYGLPYPGSFVVTPEGKIAGKWFLESYRVRLSAEALLQESLDALQALAAL